MFHPRALFQEFSNVKKYAIGGLCASVMGYHLSSDKPNGQSFITPLSLLNCENNAINESNSKDSSFKSRAIGHYENRIRYYAHPLKVFNYFASIEFSPQEFYMTSKDFVRSLIPYRDVESTADLSKSVTDPGGKQLIQAFANISDLADTNGDGLIDFDEYLVFMGLLSTPENLFELAFDIFDTDKNGALEYKEFVKVMDSHATAVYARMGSKERPKHANDLKESGELKGFLASLFGEKGETVLSIESFTHAMKRLKLEILKCEFYQYDTDDNDTISLKDFAASLLSYTPYSMDIKPLTERIKTLKNSQHRVTFSEFITFDKLTKNIESLDLAMTLFAEVKDLYSEDDGITLDGFKGTVEAITKGTLSKEVIEAIFHLFDEDGDGHLNKKEFIDVIKGRRFRGLQQPRDMNFTQKLSKVWEAVKENFFI